MADSPGTLFQLLETTPFSAGQALPAAQLYFYETGTTTDQDVYTTPACTVEHDQPVVADANGLFPAIYLNPDASVDYRVKLDDSDDNQIWQYDNVKRFSENFETDTFEVTYSGFSADPSNTTATWFRFGRLVNLILPLGTGTSNSTGFSISGLPVGLRPATTQYCHLPFAQDNGSHVTGGAVAVVANSTSIIIALASAAYATTSWTNSSTKGILTSGSIWYRLKDD